MHAPDRPLDPPEYDELPTDEFICYGCGDRRSIENLAYTRTFPHHRTEEVCTWCATAAGLHQCRDCGKWGDEETVFEIASDRGEWRCEACAAMIAGVSPEAESETPR